MNLEEIEKTLEDLFKEMPERKAYILKHTFEGFNLYTVSEEAANIALHFETYKKQKDETLSNNK